MKIALHEIKNQIFDRIIFYTVIFISIPYFASLVRTFEIGWQNIYILHTGLYFVFLFIYFFRKKLDFKFKILAFSIMFGIVAIAGLYSFGFTGAFYFCFLPIILNGVLQGRKIAFIYFLIISLFLLAIAFGFVTKRISPLVDLNTYQSTVTGWIGILMGIIFVSFVILISTSELYNFFIYAIGEKDKSTSELSLKSQQLQHIFDNSQVIMLLLNENAEVVNINKPGIDFAQSNLEDILNRKSGDTLKCLYSLNGESGCQHGDKCKDCVIRNSIFETLKTGKSNNRIEAPFTTNFNNVVKDYIFNISTSLIFNQENDEKRILVTMDDITERKKAELALENSEKRYKELFNATNEAIFIQDVNTGEILDVNDTAIKMYACDSKMDLLHKNVYHFSATEMGYTQEKAINIIASANFDTPLTFEWLGRKKNGIVFWSEVSLRKTTFGGENRLLATVRDIDARKKAEQLLNERDETLRKVFSKSADGVLLIEDEIFTDCNDAAIQLLGYSERKEIIGIHPWEISPNFQPDGLESIIKAQEMMTHCLDKGYHRFEWVHLKKNKDNIILDIVLTPININNKQIIHCVWRDITDRKRMIDELEQHRTNLEELVQKRTKDLEAATEEWKSTSEQLADKNTELTTTIQHLKEAQTQLLQAEKMASLGILTAGVAHEINNPLNFIMGGYVGLENHFNSLSDPYPKNLDLYIKSIKTGVERVDKIVKGLNQFSRDTDSYNEKVNLNEIISNCLIILQNKIKDKITISQNYHDEAIIIKGNAGKLHQVFLNILHNAIQSIETTGEITISSKKKDDLIQITITDTGYGIEEQNLLKVTDPFFTTKEPGEGTGLGLSISYSIVKEHKGKIDIKSEVNKGTSVQLSLPEKT